MKLDGLYIHRTYSGCLEGIPSVQAIIMSAKTLAQNLSGSAPVHVVDPELQKSGEDWLLPRWRFIALFRGPPLRTGDGSHLIVIWFDDELPMVFLPRVNWEAQAEDYCD
jgi:hypothetical protein